eukprot:gene4957-8551_t
MTSWTELEDEKLTKIVESMSCKECVNIYRPDCTCEVFKKKQTWEEIAKQMKSRTYGACQGRWCSQLDPLVHKESWTKEEEELLMKIYSKKEYNTWVKRALKLMEVNEGQKDTVHQNSLYIYDLDTFKFHEASSFETKQRINHSNTIFKPNLKKFQPEPRERQGFTKIDLAGKQSIMLFGGIGPANQIGVSSKLKFFEELWELELPHERFEKTVWSKPKVDGSKQPKGRYDHTFLGYAPHKVVLFGGFGEEKRALNDLWILNLKTDKLGQNTAKWKCISESEINYGTDLTKPAPRFQHSSVSMKDKVYIFGGKNEHGILNDLWYLQVSNYTWTRIKHSSLTPTPRFGHMSTIIFDTLFIFGGFSNVLDEYESHYSNTVFSYDIDENRWFSMKMKEKNKIFPDGRIGFGSCVVSDHIYIYGGLAYSNEFDDFGRVCDFWTLNTHLLHEERKIGNYTIIKKLDFGSFSDVFKVREKNTKDIYALKRIHVNWKMNSNQFIVPDFDVLGETYIPKTLQHKNVLSIKTSFLAKKGDSVFVSLIMPFCDLGDFLKVFHKNNLTEVEILYFILQLLDGMNYIHSQNVIHRDIKPKNILVISERTHDNIVVPIAKIADFGLAKNVTTNKAKTVLGTQIYMAPEVEKRIGSYSFSADVYSLGVLIFFMFTKQEINFKIKKNSNLIHELQNSDFKYKNQYVGIIKDMLNEKPEKRPSCFECHEIFKKNFLKLLDTAIGNPNSLNYIPLEALKLISTKGFISKGIVNIATPTTPDSFSPLPLLKLGSKNDMWSRSFRKKDSSRVLKELDFDSDSPGPREINDDYDDSGMFDSLFIWLCNLQMIDYEELFIEHGYDDLNIVKDMTVSDLKNIGIQEKDDLNVLELSIAELREYLDPNDMSFEEFEIRCWLNFNSLEVYETIILEKFSSLREISELSLEDLKKLEITKRGHLKKFEQKIQELKQKFSQSK